MSDTSTTTALPTVVLVHGAWADSSSWSGVIERLTAAGYPVRAIANPLQGVENDTAYLSAILSSIEGPVVLVGHSYGGAVITNVDASKFDLKALVYVAGFIPAAGETVGELAGQSTPPLTLANAEVPGGVEVIIEPSTFRASFAGDVSETEAAVLAIVQRPANVKAVAEPITQQAFQTVPAFALITTQDQAINPDLQRMMVGRTSAKVSEIDASHAVMVSRPDVVADLIVEAAR